MSKLPKCRRLVYIYIYILSWKQLRSLTLHEFPTKRTDKLKNLGKIDTNGLHTLTLFYYYDDKLDEKDITDFLERNSKLHLIMNMCIMLRNNSGLPNPIDVYRKDTEFEQTLKRLKVKFGPKIRVNKKFKSVFYCILYSTASCIFSCKLTLNCVVENDFK